MYLYVIQSKRNFSFYIGTTLNLAKRLKEHNNKLSQYTKNKGPWKLIYVEWYRSRKDTLDRERMLKKHKGGWRKLRERIKNSVLSEQN